MLIKRWCSENIVFTSSMHLDIGSKKTIFWGSPVRYLGCLNHFGLEEMLTAPTLSRTLSMSAGGPKEPERDNKCSNRNIWKCNSCPFSGITTDRHTSNPPTYRGSRGLKRKFLMKQLFLNTLYIVSSEQY